MFTCQVRELDVIIMEEAIMSDLKGKRVLVTGTSRGAGYGIAKAFTAAGADDKAALIIDIGRSQLRKSLRRSL